MDVEQVPRLRVLSSQHAPRPIEVNQTVLCSPHDLVAIVTHTQDVVIYRLNGQIAYTIKNPEADTHDEDDADSALPSVTALRWSPFGQSLAVAWSDGTWNIHESEKGEVVLKHSVADEARLDDKTHVVNFDWRQHDVSSIGGIKKQRHTKAWMGAESVDDQHTTEADLPRSITLLDVTAALPKLSALPSHGLRTAIDGAKFANQAATDSIFSSIDSTQRKSQVETLIVQASDGTSRIMLEGISHVGTVRGSTKKGSCCTTGLPQTSSIATFSQDVDTGVSCEMLQLPLTELDSALLHVLAHCTSQLTALTLYVQRAAQCVAHDFTAGHAYPDRLIKSVSMSMEEREDSNASLSSAMVHLAMTGQFHPDVLEWLVDIVKETGLKRWDASMSGMYSAIQTHLHLHMLPALDRIGIAASRIRGFARLHQGSATFAPDETLFDTVLAQSDALRDAVRATLNTCITEWSLWRAFAKWLKMQIEIGTSIPGTKSAGECEERDSINIDIHKVLQYAQSVLVTGSVLQAHIQTGSSVIGKPVDTTIPDRKQSPKILSTVSSLTEQMHDSIQAATSAITRWQGRLFTGPSTLELHFPESEEIRDVTLMGGSADSRQDTVLIATLCTNPSHQLTLYTAHLADASGVGPPPPRPLELRPVLAQQDIVDACFVQHQRTLLMLRENAGVAEDSVTLERIDLESHDGTAISLHHFDSGARPKARRIFAGGRQGKEFCVIFGENNTTWQVLDLRTTATRL